MLSRRLVGSLVLLCAAAACSDDDDGLSPQNAAIVQYVNASSTGPVTGTAASASMGSALNFQSASSACQLVSPGSSLGFAENGTSLTTTSATTLAAGQRYTVILYGTGTTRQMMVLPEVFPTITAGNYGLRIVNATSQAGNIYVTTPTGAATGTATTTLTSGAATGGTTGTNGFMSTPTANTRIRFYGAASTTTALGDFTVTNPSTSQVRTVVFANNATGGVVAFEVPQCTV